MTTIFTDSAIYRERVASDRLTEKKINVSNLNLFSDRKKTSNGIDRTFRMWKINVFTDIKSHE